MSCFLYKLYPEEYSYNQEGKSLQYLTREESELKLKIPHNERKDFRIDLETFLFSVKVRGEFAKKASAIKKDFPAMENP